jgi:hypothetical protein
MPQTSLTKILIRFYSLILEDETTEVMWAKVVDAEKGYYKITNIPFYAPKLAVGDTVWADYNAKEGMFVYRKTTAQSGNSTVQCIRLNDVFKIDALERIFEDLGCNCMKLNQHYFAIDVPFDVDYLPIKNNLDELHRQKVINYTEAFISDKHQYKKVSF